MRSDDADGKRHLRRWIWCNAKQIIADAVAPAVVVGWFRPDPADGVEVLCSRCGQPTDRPWFAVLSDGKLQGPVCDHCSGHKTVTNSDY